MTLDEFERKLRESDLVVRAYLVGKLMRQAKPDDVLQFVFRRRISPICGRRSIVIWARRALSGRGCSRSGKRVDTSGGKLYELQKPRTERYIDPAIQHIAKQTESVFPSFIAKAEQEIIGSARPHRHPSDRLARAQAFAASKAARLATSLTVDRWLWLMRRLSPAVYAAAPQRLHVFDWYFTETAAALHAAPGAMADGHGSILRQKTISTVLLFLAFALWDSNLRARQRCSVLGVPLDDGELPESVRTDAAFEALTLHDIRRQAESVPFGRWGTLAGAVARSNVEFSIRQYFRGLSYRWVSVESVGRKLDPREVLAFFYSHVIDVTSVREALSDPMLTDDNFGRDTLHLIMLLKAIEMIVCLGVGPAEELLSTGICYVDSQVFTFAATDAVVRTRNWARDACDRWKTAATPGELEEALRSMSQDMRLDPLRCGPILYDTMNGHLGLNAASASQALMEVFEFPQVSGASANRRAKTFEIEIQHLIDSTRRAPPPALRSLVGRDLILRGKKVTDVDALALDGNTVVLVSCKSFPFRAIHDSGDYRSLRNVSSDIVKAVDDWERRVATLRENPVGANYDLSEYRLIGVVCTPLVMYVKFGAATEIVFGPLRRYVSATEFANWLLDQA